MRKLDTSQATATTVQPVKAETLNFIQQASIDSFNVLASALTGIFGSGNVIVINGCVQTISVSGAYSITAGVVWLNGEWFNLLSSGPFTPSGGNVPILQLIISQDTNNADPVTFSDLVQRNVHNIRQVQVVAGGIATQNFLSFFTVGTNSPNVVYPPLNVPAVTTGLQNEITRATNAESFLTGLINQLDIFKSLEQSSWAQDTNTVNWVPTTTSGTPVINSSVVDYLLSGKKLMVNLLLVVDLTSSVITKLTYTSPWLTGARVGINKIVSLTYGGGQYFAMLNIPASAPAQITITPISTSPFPTGPDILGSGAATITIQADFVCEML